MRTALVFQLVLLIYHQVTTLIDFHPFNGSRHYSRQEKMAEAVRNGVLMSLGPIGFGFLIHPLMTFGMVYYFVLFVIELLIWWVPYLSTPAGRWRRIYNRLLAYSTSNFQPGDTLGNWVAIYNRLHRGTITFLPSHGDRPVPNLEHTILHALTLVTALVTAAAYFHG